MNCVVRGASLLALWVWPHKQHRIPVKEAFLGIQIGKICGEFPMAEWQGLDHSYEHFQAVQSQRGTEYVEGCGQEDRRRDQGFPRAGR